MSSAQGEYVHKKRRCLDQGAMAGSSQRKLRLSKGLLQMKFMQRSKVRQMEDEAAEEGRAMYERDITEGMKAGGDKFIIEQSYAPLEGLVEGRFSFGGMSPHIEKIMAEEERVKLPQLAYAEMDADIPADEVAKTYLANVMASKYMSKKERRKFIRPADDD